MQLTSILIEEKMRGHCCRHHGEETGSVCSCEMGNLYRFAEPIILLTIAKAGEAHGYQIAQEAAKLAVTHAGLDSGVIYRVLRRLEVNGRVSSKWDTSGGGPARRLYALTDSGRKHLAEWGAIMKDIAKSLQALSRECHQAAEAVPVEVS